ncbi:ExbD/TolR family protein [Thermoproteota archaeon]
MEFQKPKQSGIQIELTPILDMVFILLIFFMLGATFLKPAVNLKLPAAHAGITKLEPSFILIQADKTGTIFLNHDQINLNKLSSKTAAILSQNHTITKARIQADKGMNYGLFLAIVDALKIAGIEGIALEHETVDF